MDKHKAARLANAALGAWVFISAFLWMHNEVQFANACVVGLVCVGTALLGLSLPQARYFNALLALWLFLTIWLLPLDAAATFWNHTLAAGVMLYVALKPRMPSGREPFQPAGTR